MKHVTSRALVVNCLFSEKSAHKNFEQSSTFVFVFQPPPPLSSTQEMMNNLQQRNMAENNSFSHPNDYGRNQPNLPNSNSTDRFVSLLSF